MAKILVIDNFDSFTYNLVQYLGQLGAEVEVRRNDAIDPEGIVAMAPDGIMLSPGPCTPSRAGVCLSVLAGALGDSTPNPLFSAAGDSTPNPLLFAARKGGGFFDGLPIFGVCLGHQAMGHVSGAEVRRAGRVMHGKTSMVRHDGKGVFERMPNPFRAVRYHSLVVTQESLPEEFEVTATAEDDGEIMGIRHRTKPIEGVQFHPESVLTEGGIRIVENFLRLVEARKALSAG